MLLVLVGGASLPPALAQEEGPPEVPDHLRAYSIFPPGQEGNVTAPELSSGDFGPHYDHWVERYAALVDDDDVTEQELPDYFHSMQFGIGAGETIERTYSPTDGVTVFRDSEGVPHIYGDSLETATFALGYTTAEDRLWQMEIFRHAARGTLAELVGPGQDDAFLQMDIGIRREGYTEAEIQEMFEALDEKFGDDGAQVQAGLRAYADGINAYIDEVKTTRFDERPVEYEATGNPFPQHPEPWTPEDTLFLVVLQLRVFGELGGAELANAAVLQRLQDRLGPRQGRRVWEDFFFLDDPRSPTTIPAGEGSFPSQDLGELDPESVAIPDGAEEMAEQERQSQQQRARVLRSLGFQAPSSNMLVVAPEKSKTGNTLHFGAPQVGYANPSFFWEADVHAPGVDFRGPAVPGASALIPLGRGRDYAWSLTTGVSDNVDVRAELLCDPDGGEPTVDSNAYVFQGECVEMESRTETFVVKPTPVDPGAPRVEQHTFFRTVHGPVFDRGTVDGAPAAFVKERSFWMKEIDSIPSFLRWNTQVESVEDFIAAAEDFTMTFNAFYADADDIGYVHVGHFPVQAQGTSWFLPTWGTGEWEWENGRFPFARHPKIVNPDQGWMANWNNKPARGWFHNDEPYWGPLHRVRLLQRSMGNLLRGPRKASLSDLVDVIADAATRDANAAFLGPRMTRWAIKAAQNPEIKRAGRIVKRWVRDGAHRQNADRDETMDRGNALAIFDTWFETLVHRVFGDELGEDFSGVPVSLTGYSPTGGSSFGFGFKDHLDPVLRPRLRDTLARDYCDRMGTPRNEPCPKLVLRSLRHAVRTLAEEQGEDMSAWTTEAENLAWQNLGAGSVERIPWQNRGTHNHAVEVLGRAE